MSKHPIEDSSWDLTFKRLQEESSRDKKLKTLELSQLLKIFSYKTKGHKGKLAQSKGPHGSAKSYDGLLL
jgi:hypothetical protein